MRLQRADHSPKRRRTERDADWDNLITLVRCQNKLRLKGLRAPLAKVST